MFRPGERVAAIFDQPADRPLDIHVVKGGLYQIFECDDEHGLVTLAGDRPRRWLSALGFERVLRQAQDRLGMRAGDEGAARNGERPSTGSGRGSGMREAP